MSSTSLDPVLRTRFCDLVDIDVPVVQTGMGWVAGASLTAATSSAGGLGIIASTTMTYEQLVEAIAEVKARTDRPFGVNMRPNQGDVDKVAELLIREEVKLASFALAPNERLIKTLRDGGVVTMPTVAAPRHAEKVAAWGVDAMIAQGQEGGGHTGSIPTSILLPAVTAAVDVPVLGAGGFSDGRGLVAALGFGAAGIAMGTRFLMTRESTVPDHIKQLYLEAGPNDTVVSFAIDGKPQRVIRTRLIERLERGPRLLTVARAMQSAFQLRSITGASLGSLVKEGLAMRKGSDLTLAQVLMAANSPMLTRATMVDGHEEAGILPTGQVAGILGKLPTVAELIERLVEEANAAVAQFAPRP